ncbi:hypothetical protein LPJ61_001680 [Coemansia biformis]|uniref:Extracellular membrane protein CFEM domain-containing protein n=1 Tax=Coemansia biformis TaxID=1286918 RepID=A0A9W8CX28_9FUNG|nr:hypothetical protein LPJ61_001680 [Coemansia biformis]
MAGALQLVLAALAGLAASASSVPSVPVQLAPFLPTAGPLGGAKVCDAQNVLDTCLATQGQVLAMCSYSDWACKCQAQRSIAGCFLNCPSDGGRTAHEGQVIVFCNAAKSTHDADEKRSALAKQSPAAKAAPPAPSRGGSSDDGAGSDTRSRRRPAATPRGGTMPAAAAAASPLSVVDDAAGPGRALPALGLGLMVWMAL